jgi:hypothetical protein
MSRCPASPSRTARPLRATRPRGPRGGGRPTARTRPSHRRSQVPTPGRHCHSTLSVVGCHSLGICTVILLSLLSFSVKMTVSPWATRHVHQAADPAAQRRALRGLGIFRPEAPLRELGRRARPWVLAAPQRHAQPLAAGTAADRGPRPAERYRLDRRAAGTPL